MLVINVVTFIHCSLQDYVSVWQIRDALERSRIVPVFVIQFDLRCAMLGNMLVCPDTRLQREPYEDLLQEFDLRNIRGQFRLFNSSPGQNPSDVTEELINIIQGAYSVSIDCNMTLYVLGWGKVENYGEAAKVAA